MPFQQDRDVQDEDAPAGGTGAAGAGDAEKGPRRVPGVLPVTRRNRHRGRRGCSSAEETAAGREGRPGAPRSSLELGLAILQQWVPAVTHSSGCPNHPSPTQEQPQEWGLPCTGACWGPGWFCCGWGKLGCSTPSISTGMGTGHPPTISTCHKGGLEHQLPPGRTPGVNPEGDPRERDLKAVPVLPTP